MKPMNIAVLSDLHIGTAVRSRDLFPEYDLEKEGRVPPDVDENYQVSFIEFLKTLSVKIDVLVIPGDVTNQAQPEEISLASTFIEKVLSALDLTAEQLVFVPGNHDVDWEVLKLGTGELRQRQRYAPLLETPSVFRDCLQSAKGSVFESPYFSVWECGNAVFLGYNSSWHDKPNEALHRGVLDPMHAEHLDRYLDDISLSDYAYRVFVVHHHPVQYASRIQGVSDFSQMVNSEILFEILTKHSFDFAIHGHTHQPRFSTQSFDAGNPIAILAAGTFSWKLPLTWREGIGNTFHVMEVHGRDTSTGYALGGVRTWSHTAIGWIPSDQSRDGIHAVDPFGGYIQPDLLRNRLAPLIKEAFREREYLELLDLSHMLPNLPYMRPARVLQALERLSEDCGFSIRDRNPESLLLQATRKPMGDASLSSASSQLVESKACAGNSHQKQPSEHDLFSITNARNLLRDELVSAFVPNNMFLRLLSPNNQLLSGSRGTGKTYLLKMLSHENLRFWDGIDKRTANVANRLIGIYVPCRIHWVQGISPLHENETERINYFQFQVNLSAAIACLRALESCLEHFVVSGKKRSSLEEKICKQLSVCWSKGEHSFSAFSQLSAYLQDLEYQQGVIIAKRHFSDSSSEPVFGNDIPLASLLFDPVNQMIQIVQREGFLPASVSWALCLDETEFLAQWQQRLINDQLRSVNEQLCFKLASVPFAHTMNLTSTGQLLGVGNDFDVIDMDAELRDQVKAGEFFRELFKRQTARVAGENYTLDKCMGVSSLFATTTDPHEWLSTTGIHHHVLLQHASSQLIEQLTDDSISEIERNVYLRKIRNALVLRDAVHGRKRTAPTVYSGADLVVRVVDGNPRRFLLWMNHMFNHEWVKSNTRDQLPRIRATVQAHVLQEFGQQLLQNIVTEPVAGGDVHDLVQRIATFFHKQFMIEKVVSDRPGSFLVDSDDERLVAAVRYGVQMGLIVPLTSSNTIYADAISNQRFRLTFALSPYFKLLPEVGRSLPLSHILKTEKGKRMLENE